MQLIKDQQIIDNTWQYIADTDELKSGDISVSFARWQADKQQLLAHDGKLGIRISSADSVDELVDDLDTLKLIELDFPDFADGRLFSQAWLLRGRYHYQGEIRAIGHYIPDQVFYLARVGVNAFSPKMSEELADIINKLKDFTVNYQSSIN
ncbi:MAG: DUF934 domain-containing protein [Methylococcales bacterium]|jgi:uncharacterized protein (DUF934 family)|nr:MAG: DUF934 domain-containing protein [Methylococcales bacterium]